MMEPVELKDFLTVFFVSAGVILFGAAYAILYAWAEIRQSAGIRQLSHLAYASLLPCIAALAWFAHFQGVWILLAAVMAIGYFWAPRFLMKLCRSTHSLHL